MNNEEPLLSVIVPIYNVEKYLPEALDSIINQTYRNLEIILVDDGSTDNSPEICDDYKKRDRRIKVIHKSNEGVAAARNEGMKIFTGEWVTFVDPDDWLNLDFYNKIFQNAKGTKADVIISNGFYSEYVNKTVRCPTFSKFGLYSGCPEIIRITERIFSFYDKSEKRTFSLALASTVDKIYNTEIIREHGMMFTQINFAEDLLFNFIFFTKVSRVLTLNICGYHYRQRRSSAMHGIYHDNDVDSAIKFVDNVYLNIGENYPRELINAVHSRLICIIMLILRKICRSGSRLSYKQKNKILNALKANKYYSEAISDCSNEFLTSNQKIVKFFLRFNSNLPLFFLYRLNLIKKKFTKRTKLYA